MLPLITKSGLEQPYSLLALYTVVLFCPGDGSHSTLRAKLLDTTPQDLADSLQSVVNEWTNITKRGHYLIAAFKGHHEDQYGRAAPHFKESLGPDDITRHELIHTDPSEN